MKDEEHNSLIERIAFLVLEDKISLDEQDPKKLQKYHDFLKTSFVLDENSAIQIVDEAFLYLKLKSAKDIDPLQNGDKFGAGFS